MRWWFKRTAKNRRLKPEGDLGTKSARRHALAVRWRTTTLALGAALFALGAIVAVWRGGDWCLRKLVYENPAFEMRVIDIQTDGVIPIEQLRLWAGVKQGDNLLAVDLPQIKRHLELAPLIREVSVDRVLPSCLKIRVVEREPMVQAYALAAKPGADGLEIAVYYLDDEGFVMKPMDTLPRGGAAQENYAVLTGLGRADLRPGCKAQSPQVYASLRLLESFERSPMFGLVDLARIDISTPEVMLVTTGQGGEIVFGLENLDMQLRRWRAIHDYAIKQGKQIATLDLSVTNNIPAQWKQTNQVTIAPIKPVKTSRTRNKHV